MEIWKDVPGYEAHYEVSNLGKVRSKTRNITRSDGYTKTYTSKILSQHINAKRYLGLKLSKDGKTRTFNVHVLVAMAFLNHERCGYKLVVDHIDNNPINNKLSNLQVIPHRDNIKKNSRNKFFKSTNSNWKDLIILTLRNENIKQVI